MSSYKELLAQREQLDKQIKEAVLREKAEGIAKAKLIPDNRKRTKNIFFICF